MIRKALLIVCGGMLVATIALTVSSYWWHIQANYWGYQRSYIIGVDSGLYGVWIENLPPPLPSFKIHVGRVSFRALWLYRLYSFHWSTSPRMTILFFPAWLPMTVLALLTWLLARPLLRVRRRHRRGLCISCGYDLTGNTSGRCPECGATVKQGTTPEA